MSSIALEDERAVRPSPTPNIDNIVSQRRSALRDLPTDHPDRATLLKDLGMALSQRFNQTGLLSDLDEVILLRREALQRPPYGDRSIWLNYLASALQSRFKRTTHLPDLDEALLLFREALNLRPTSDSHRSCWLSNLARNLVTRFETTGHLPDLDEAIASHREALCLRPAPNPHRYLSLLHLATALRDRFKQRGHLPDLDEAIVLHGEALTLPPAPHPDQYVSLYNLAVSLQTRFEETGQLTDADKAVSLHRQALKLRPGSKFHYSMSLTNLGAALCARFEHVGQIQDLDEAISLHRESVALRPAPNPSRSSSLKNLASALGTRFHHTGHFPNLDEAISVNREALALQHTQPHYRPLLLNTLAVNLRLKFLQTAQLEGLDEAVSLHREALALWPAVGPQRSLSLDNLAATLQTRFKQTGQLSDLDEAVLLHREALTLRPAPNPNQSLSLSNLAVALMARFEQMGQPSDLEEAISLHSEALSLRPSLNPNRPPSLTNLAIVLQLRYKQSNCPQDADEAVLLHREALTLRPGSNPERSLSLNNLATALQIRFEKTHQLPDADEAIILHRKALLLRPEPNPDRLTSLNNLAVVLQAKYEQTSRLPDLDEAIALCVQALRSLPKEHPNVCIFLINQGTCLHARSKWKPHRRDETDEQWGVICKKQSEYFLAATDAFQAAVRCESASVSKRFNAAREWALLYQPNVSDELTQSALEAHETAIGLLPQLAAVGLDLKSRQQALTLETDGLARDAAACAIQFQKFEKAIELLETGRAIFWSQALRLRTRLDDLALVAPELAQKLTNISRALEQGALREVSRSASDLSERVISIEKEAVYYRELNDKWLKTVEEVRKVDGFQDFLRSQSYETLSAAAANGPVVILIASKLRSRCDALVLRSSQDPTHIPLPLINVELAERLVKRIRSLSEASIPLARTMIRVSPGLEDPDMVFQNVLEKLWTYVVQPIFNHLNLKKTNSPPRLWWLPTGPFASLPIHAAGIYDAAESECVNAGDYVISSYTPTLNALLTPSRVASEPFNMLVAIQPTTEGHEPLPCTREELCKIEERAPKGSLVKFGIPGAAACVESVLSALLTASIVHLACHGVQDVKNPLDSALLLEDGRLKVSQLMQLSMPNATLVFLSACQTAMVGENLPDEPIHLATTLLFCGFNGAVATMWSIQDSDGPTVASSFYQQLFSTSINGTKDASNASPDTTRAAHALHLAVEKFREKLHAEKAPSRFCRWVPFVHFGL